MIGLQLSDPHASQAVLIGVHKYDDSSDLTQIEAVERNLTGMGDALCDPQTWGLPPGHLSKVSQPATAANILDEVMAAGDQATDTLVIYYAGHGLTDTDSPELYLALPASRNFRLDTAFRYELLRRYLSSPKLRARRVVVILDCCWSGRALIGPMDGSDGLADLAAVPGRCVLTASAATKIAMAPPGETYTAFTGVLLKLLTDGVPRGPELLDMETLYVAAHEALEAKSRPLPQLGGQGSPSLICIARNRAEERASIPHQESPRRPPSAPPPRPSGVPHRMPALVRECLREPPQPASLSVVPLAKEENYAIRSARDVHRLGPGEMLIAVWQFEDPFLFRSKASSLAFTSRGISIFKRGELFNLYNEPFPSWL